jgi:hypothetical protein
MNPLWLIVAVLQLSIRGVIVSQYSEMYSALEKIVYGSKSKKVSQCLKSACFVAIPPTVREMIEIGDLERRLEVVFRMRREVTLRWSTFFMSAGVLLFLGFGIPALGYHLGHDTACDKLILPLYSFASVVAVIADMRKLKKISVIYHQELAKMDIAFNFKPDWLTMIKLSRPV